MTEKLLQFIWQFQHFRPTDLFTTTGEAVEVLHAGQPNRHQGPDFLDARIRIGDTLLAGSVELHLKTSLWQVHGHTGDPLYQNVVLHVVYEDDRPDDHTLPVLELQPLLPSLLLDQYQKWMDVPEGLACGPLAASVDPLVWVSWKDRLLTERLIRRSEDVLKLLEEEKGSWEVVSWRLLARSFGGPVNAEAFEEVARSLPLRILYRHRQQIQQLEALLLGQAGLLETDFSEAYPKMLRREYQFLRKKLGLRPIVLPVLFLRMRPGGFPTLRLAQLAALLQGNEHLPQLLLETADLHSLRQQLAVSPNDYWLYHYRLDEPGKYKVKAVGEAAINGIVVNVVAPLLFSHGRHRQMQGYKDRALAWLQQLPAEDNGTVRLFTKLGIEAANGGETQALLELHRQYCQPRRCLDCAIGYALLRKKSEIGYWFMDGY